mgnify:CR=1 FL=1
MKSERDDQPRHVAVVMDGNGRWAQKRKRPRTFGHQAGQKSLRRIVEHAARTCREHGLWGAVARTNSGPEDPVWHEYPERLRRVNAVFVGKKP